MSSINVDPAALATAMASAMTTALAQLGEPGPVPVAVATDADAAAYARYCRMVTNGQPKPFEQWAASKGIGQAQPSQPQQAAPAKPKPSQRDRDVQKGCSHYVLIPGRTDPAKLFQYRNGGGSERMTLAAPRTHAAELIDALRAGGLVVETLADVR